MKINFINLANELKKELDSILDNEGYINEKEVEIWNDQWDILNERAITDEEKLICTLLDGWATEIYNQGS